MRLQRGWSQDQLSELSGLSVRTIQRIERGQKPGLESLKSLAAVFEIEINDLQTEPDRKHSSELKDDEKVAMEQVTKIKNFYSNLVTYIFVIILLFVINYVTNPDTIWAWWPALGWGIGIVSHGLRAFEIINIFTPEWEKKQIEKRIVRK